MAFKVIIKPLAVMDLDEAIDWYEEKSKGLGKRFYLQFEIAIDNILKDPNAFFNITPHVRRILLKKFPYRLFYIMSDDAIIVLGVMHTKRSKRYIRRRLK